MSFKDYILNVHPDPDFLGDKKVYDAYDELDRLAQNYAKDKISNLKKELQEAKTSDGRGWKAVDRLQRGNDALRNQVDDLNDELTRLRELLDESKDLLLIASTGYPQIEFLERVKKLITEIENALNHKP